MVKPFYTPSKLKLTWGGQFAVDEGGDLVQAEALAMASEQGEPVEREALRAAQAAVVMPLIGPLLDAWENADREVMSAEPELSRQLAAINRAMEDADTAQPAPAVPAEQEAARWSAYVGGMVAHWIKSEPDAHARLGDDKFEAAIAGIIERRMWALKREPAPAAAPDVLTNIAAIAHAGGLEKLSEGDALTAIRSLTIPHWRQIKDTKKALVAAMSTQRAAGKATSIVPAWPTRNLPHDTCRNCEATGYTDHGEAASPEGPGRDPVKCSECKGTGWKDGQR